MTANLAPNLTRLTLARPLTMRLRKKYGAPVLAREPVRGTDFADVVGEAWRDGCLRHGHPGLPMADLPMRLSPILAENSESRCTGFEVELTLPNGQTTHCGFSHACLRHVAERVTTSLTEAGMLKLTETCVYEVVVDEPNPPFQLQPAASLAVTVSLHSPGLAFLKVPLRPLLERATPVALLEDELPPVFYTQEALARSEACARRGTDVESGGALFGSLAACPETGEFFPIIHDVVEVQDAEEKQFSLAYSSRSWQRLQKIQQARQAAYPLRADRLLGQTHGHPFRPNDGKQCAECEQRATCTLSSAWVSSEDRLWHKSVFARQPWALCHIFGLSARGEPVHQLFGLRDGRLQPRGFYLLPDFPFD